jgi:hypothetical protein
VGSAGLIVPEKLASHNMDVVVLSSLAAFGSKFLAGTRKTPPT